MQRVRITISGFVQGIFFRDFVRKKAKELGLKGYVKNIENNKVEIVVEGHEIKINKLTKPDILNNPAWFIAAYITCFFISKGST